MAMSSILVIGGTGNIGQHLVEASLNAGHPTAVLVRPATVSANSGKARLLEGFKARGASLVYGDMNDHASLVAAMKRHGEVVISAVGHGRPGELDGQLKIIDAIKEVENVKLFMASEFGCNVERADQTLQPAKAVLDSKVQVRRAVRDAGIPHTMICSYWALGLLLPGVGRPFTTGLNILGEEDPPVIFLDEKDISKVAIRAVDDSETLDKIMYVRPHTNMCSFSHLVHLLEKKIGRTIQRNYLSVQELATKIQESPFPVNFQLAMLHSTVVHAGECVEAIDASVAVEATRLYPDIKFVTVEEYIHRLLL